MWCDGSYYSARTMKNQADDCKPSDTPRTDDFLYEPMGSMCRAYAWDKETFVPSCFARTLERELNEANARIKELEDELARVADELHAERERD